MVFSSLVFIWVFLPIVFVLNYLVKPQYSNILLLLASLFFYAWGEPYLVLLMLLSIGANYGIGIAIDNRRSRSILLGGVFLNLSILGYYKYAGFSIRIINTLMGREMIPVPNINLPIGISFFTFQAISYLADVYKGEVNAQKNPINVALYISFFPQLIAGPIVKYKDINQQIESRSITWDRVADGFRRFIYGLSKKVLISNVLGQSADVIFAQNMNLINSTMAWCGALLYTFQIYYDFSGYSDMAIGLGKMFGFDIPENFNYPYLSKTVGEFWRKWHISLGAWFREYVYIPLGGNRKGKLRTYINLGVVFFLTGLWHGANYTFIAWGLFHGLFSILERKGLQRLLNKYRLLSHFYLFLVITFGWVIFRIPSLKDGLRFIKRMLLPWLYLENDFAWWQYGSNHTIFILICAVLGMGIIQKIVPEKVKNMWKYSLPEAVYCIVMLIICMAAMASNTYNPFIYFQF